ncbi:MAG: DUF5050 domain-containing protein [Candidatus Nanoarchaeia archaeon]|nr:DUF5050 domain-containing protein [Candidatus Nanoarchaeia archaeon]
MTLEKIVSSGKNLFRKILLASAVTAATLMTTACPPKPDPEPENPSGGSTHVLTEEEAGQISEVTDNELFFSQPVDYKEGDIIVSGITDETPNGLFREVTGVSSDGTIVDTETASLEYAVENTDVSFNTALSSEGAKFAGPKGISFSRGVSDAAFHLIFDEAVLLDFDGIPNNGNEIVANGEITFNINVFLGAVVEDWSLKRFEFRVDVPETAELSIGTSENFGAIDAQATLGEFRIPAFTIGYIPTPIGLPIPLIVKPRLEIIAKIGGGVSQIAVGVTQDATASVGLLYENFQWSPIAEIDNSFEFIPPVFSDVLSFKASVGPKLAFRLYDIAGPYGELNGFLRFDFDTGSNDWSLYGGLEATLGADMKIFRKVLLDYSAKVLDEEWLLASGESEVNHPPVITPGDSLFLTLNKGETLTHDVDAVDEDGDTLTYYLTVNSAEDWLSIDSSTGLITGTAPMITTDYEYYNPMINVSDGRGGTDFQLTTIKVENVSGPTGEKILFVSGRDGNYEIYIMNADGSNQVNLTNNPAQDFDPSWSPDGNKIAYVSGTTLGNSEIWIMDSDGSNRTRITYNDLNEGNPVWSPDGNRMAYCMNKDWNSSNFGWNYEIYTMDIDGTDQTNLTNDIADDRSPAWSPNGDKIAFTSNRNSGSDIYIMNSNGSGVVDRINNPGFNDSPSWSPDGSRILFDNATGSESGEIYTMNPNGTNVTNLTNNANTEDIYPSWSPDGNKIAYVSGVNGGSINLREIWIMDSNGSNKTRITNNNYSDVSPVWSPVPIQP